MAVIFNIKCKNENEMFKVREDVHDGLCGSPAYINSEIAVCDLQDDAFTLIVGCSNEHDVEYDINATINNALLKR